MDLQIEKIELAKRVLDTEDQNIIDAIKSIFKDFDSKEDWGDLSDKVIADAKASMDQIEAGMGVSHEQVRDIYKKWL
jgi:hypothetical protein